MLLALTTATPRCSVAVLDDAGQVLATDGYVDEMMHAERLFSVIDAVVAASGSEREQLEAVCCDIGPGSFTGLRVGVASAKGIAFGLGIPMIAVLSLEAMAAATFAEPDLEASVDAVACVLDAKRGERFLAVFGRLGERLMEPRCVASDALLDAVDTCQVARPNLRLCGDALTSARSEDPRLADFQIAESDGCGLPHAQWIGRCGLRHFAAGRRDDLATIEPVYVRPPDAKLPAISPERNRLDHS